DIPILVTVESMAPDKFDAGLGISPIDDRLAAYFKFPVAVKGEPPIEFAVIDPNGGEKLYMTLDHEIIWNTYAPGVTDVKIEWSSDDFVSDINTIITNTPNNGSFLWEYIPKVMTDTAKIRISDVGGTIADDSDDYFSILPPVWLNFQDPVTVSTTTVEFSMVPYLNWDEISPAISQDRDGPVHICWHDEIAYPEPNYREARDVVVRSNDGDYWTGQGGFLFTGGGSAQEIHELRRDYMKLAPAANNTTFAAVWHWSIYFSLDVDHFINGPHYYYNAYTLFNRIYKAEEIMADDDYLYLVSDGDVSMGDGPGIYSYRFNTPNYMWAGWPGSTDPIPSLNVISSYGEISHSRSWAFRDDLLCMAYYTNSNQIKLLKQTDYANDIWDDTEIIFNGAGYSESKNPGLSYDSNNNLYVVWTGLNASTAAYDVLVSMSDSPGNWTAPMVIASSTTDFFDDQHSSFYATPFELPNGDMENLLLIGYEVDSHTYYQIVLLDAWDWLPPLEVDAPYEVIRDPDTMCIDPAFGYKYDALITWSSEVIPGTIGYGNWDIKFRNGDFEIP
ncbi:MAG: hypothetical protein ABIC40_03765, partial [bacterium]